MSPETWANPFHHKPTDVTDMEKRRADLPPAERARVDRMYAELKNLYAQYGVDSVAEALEKVRDKKIRIPKDDIRRMSQLMDLMRQELEDIPNPELDALKLRLKNILQPIADHFTKLQKQMGDGSSKDKEAEMRAKTHDFIADLLELDKVPESLLLDDPNLCQKILEAAIAGNDIESFIKNNPTMNQDTASSMLGITVSVIYKKLAERLPEPEKIVQILDLTLTGPVNSLGAFMPAGTLEIRGRAGNQIGVFMDGGEIRMEQGGDHVGQNMQNGVLHAREVGKYFCIGMEGGVASAEKAGQFVDMSKGGRVIVNGQLVSPI